MPNFKTGDKAKFTSEAKMRLDDNEYWHWVNQYPDLDKIIDNTFTVTSVQDDCGWPSVRLAELGRFYVSQELLERIG